MAVKIANQTEINNWDNLITNNPDGGNIAQSQELALIKSLNGWKIVYLIIDEISITVHQKNILGLGKFWYIPKGPSARNINDLKKIIIPLKDFAQKNGVFLIKIEPEILEDDNTVKCLKDLGLIKSKPIQPNYATVFIDISKPQEEILSGLPQSSRYAIKRAYRDGFEAKEVELTDENLNTMVGLMKETMSNKKALLRSDDYYKSFWKTFSKNSHGQLFFAYSQKKPIAGAFIQLLGKKGTYKDGGSVRDKTIYGASHALQWHIINWLKDRGVESYDLCSTPPASQINNKSHPLYGVGLFKTSFNKNITEYIGTYDVVINKSAYKIWKKFAEKFINAFYIRILKKYFY